MKNQTFFSIAVAIIIMVCACKQENAKKDAITALDMNINIERFDKYFAEATVADLPKLMKQYPFLFPEQYNNDFWKQKLQDTLQQQLSAETLKSYPELSNLEAQISSLFNHIKYYFPEFTLPRVITTTSYVDYRNQVIVTDSIVLISLDTYLGEDHKFYGGISKYIRKGFNKNQITVDMVEEYAKKYLYQNQNKTLLDEMIYHGKILYFKDLVLPDKSDAEKIGYTPEELQWAKQNEYNIWQYFVERELLYSTDSQLPARFINPAPFSKFHLEQIDNESPGKIGRYIGWQIVKAYAENNSVSVKEILQTPVAEIFNRSKFKPYKNE